MSALEETLLFHLRAVGLPEPVRELHFDWCCEHQKREHGWAPGGDMMLPTPGCDPLCNACLRPYLVDAADGYREWDDARELSFHEYRHGRAFRFDFAWPASKVAVEVEGGTTTGGRHVRPQGFERDAEKRNLAQLQGWRVLAFTRRQVTSGEALTVIERALKGAA